MTPKEAAEHLKDLLDTYGDVHFDYMTSDERNALEEFLNRVDWLVSDLR